MKPMIIIEYSSGKELFLRAANLAQQVLSSFWHEVKGVTIQSSPVQGRYTIFINDEKVFDRKEEGRFPRAKEVKKLIQNKMDLCQEQT